MLVAALGAAASARAADRVQVVVALDAPSVVDAVRKSRALSGAARSSPLSLRSPYAAGYLARTGTQQLALERRVRAAVPGAEVRWRYGVVENALAVVVPPAAVPKLERLSGVRTVYPSVRYRSALNRSPGQIEADKLWGTGFSTAGNGIKIAIVDDGVDQSHPFFDPRGYTAPSGFPKGNTRFTTAKVIVARSFPPPTPKWRNAALPFDPVHSEHGTHVAGIAAGNANTRAVDRTLSGVAPRAYIGNYKVLTIPTAADVGLDGNSAEIAAGIEAAVRDGMDVINLSLGEPEIEPTRDLVVRALGAAAAAGVVPVVAAGNDFGEFGRGSIGSPGSAPAAITAAATVNGSGELAGFSASGPTPVSLQLKPDVTAPGQGIASSVPGGWDVFSGTSMAAPHVAGAVALLLQRHPGWSPAQVKSALVTTGRPVLADEGSRVEAAATRQGGGLVTLVQALEPRFWAAPTSIALGFLRPGESRAGSVTTSDAGGGAGEWSVAVQQQRSDPRVAVAAPVTQSVPSTLTLTVTTAADAPESEHTGFVVLTRGGDRRRIPYWFRVAPRALPGARAIALARPGTYRGTTQGKPSLVDDYRYPDDPTGAGVRSRFGGPEQLYSVSIRRPVANFGVVVLGRATGVRVEARTVEGLDENRQVGYTSLPINLNPYLADFLEASPVSGAVRPKPGVYGIVFDTPTGTPPGAFTFRFWVDDTRPPSLRLLTRRIGRGGTLLVRARDTGSGVDPSTIVARLDGRSVRARYANGIVRIAAGPLGAGRHRLFLQVSDYQETRNQENVPRILPNTRRISATFVVR